MKRDILGFMFDFVAGIEPERDSRGGIAEFTPQSNYRNARGLRLNRHGQGPFCKFRIPVRLTCGGVYALTIGDQVHYIGQCQNLSERFSERGYGTIHPRNCYERGQATNCKINHLILESAKQGRQLDLWFCPSPNRNNIEERLISGLGPPWNSERGWRSITTVARGRDGLAPQQSVASSNLEAVMPMFQLTLHETYYRQGFFNVPTAHDRFVRPTDGAVELILGTSGQKIAGRINRRANQNRTARIMGGTELRRWFQENHSPGEVIDVDLTSFDSIRIGGAHLGVPSEGSPGQIRPTRGPESRQEDKEVTADELARWRRGLLR